MRHANQVMHDHVETHGRASLHTGLRDGVLASFVGFCGMAFFFKHLSISCKIVGITREEKLEVPAEALREALTNALCHRLFHNTNSSVGIAIYDDRIEIENTGHLPDELTTETIKQSHHSFPQNPTIADVLFKTTFLENWGSGVGRIMDACREANLPEPEYNQDASFVWVTFKRNTIQPYNHATPTTPTTSKQEDAKAKSRYDL